MNRSLNNLLIACSMGQSPLFSLTKRRVGGSFSLKKTTLSRVASNVLEDMSNDALEIRQTSFCGIFGSGVLINGYFLQGNQVTITEECKKTFRDTVFANITGGSNVYALYVYHSGAIVTVDKSMFCDIHLDQSLATAYIRDSKFIAFLRSCFYRLITKDHTSFVISYHREDCNMYAAINQTSEASTGEGVTVAGQYYRCREKFVYVSNNISYVSISYLHQGITIGPVPESDHQVTMNQVVETGTGAFFHIFYLDHSVSVSNINFIDNNPSDVNGCFQNNQAKNAVLENCVFSLKKNSVWFGSRYASKCVFYLIDCYINGYIPQEHSCVDTSGLIKTNTISTFKVRKIREGICKSETGSFTRNAELTMNYGVNFMFLLLK